MESSHDLLADLLAAQAQEAPDWALLAARLEPFGGCSSAMIAASRGLQGALAGILACEPDLGAIDSFGNTALHWAALGGHEACARMLLAAGAPVDAANAAGFTPAIVAAKFGKGACLAALAEAGADLQAQTRTGRRAPEIAKDNGVDDSESLILSAVEAAAISKSAKSDPKGQAQKPHWI